MKYHLQTDDVSVKIKFTDSPRSREIARQFLDQASQFLLDQPAKVSSHEEALGAMVAFIRQKLSSTNYDKDIHPDLLSLYTRVEGLMEALRKVQGHLYHATKYFISRPFLNASLYGTGAQVHDSGLYTMQMAAEAISTFMQFRSVEDVRLVEDHFRGQAPVKEDATWKVLDFWKFYHDLTEEEQEDKSIQTLLKGYDSIALT